MAKKGRWEWEDHLTQVLLLSKPAEGVEEAIQILEEHAYPAVKKLKSGFNCGEVCLCCV